MSLEKQPDARFLFYLPFVLSVLVFPSVHPETCTKVMEVCNADSDGNVCREQQLSIKLIKIGHECLAAADAEQCTDSCSNSIMEVLQFDFGYRLLTCGCSDSRGTYYQNIDCQNEQDRMQVCIHVVESWCTDAVNQCNADAACNQAKTQFEQDCGECSSQCDDSLRRLYAARSSDRLVCDCDYLFNSSKQICDTSREAMLSICASGLQPTEQPQSLNTEDQLTTDLSRNQHVGLSTEKVKGQVQDDSSANLPPNYLLLAVTTSTLIVTSVFWN
ncbi:uncharacterized protein LOC144356063 [Saccoglossus kowalevskii]|uniref:Growth arrest-specific protein 1-like 259 n=1 Tax=Saccoglossus kowalevskii TaxID=10224 RepID=A0A0U2T2X2_SACKO|nr:growth arrest-specific protein 1-like 259 [Saccoglossus kowalevskii]